MEAETSEPVRFRPSKKRKTYRQRRDSSDHDSPETHNNQETTTTTTNTQSRAVAADYFITTKDSDNDNHDNLANPDDEEEAALPAVVKARSAHKPRFRGVGFRAGSKPGETDPTEQTAVVVREAAPHGIQPTVPVSGIADRFTHQTGFVGDVNDRHMNEYIESRLSSRAEAPGQEIRQPDEQDAAALLPDVSSGAGDAPTVKQPAMHGNLMEVDLPVPNAVAKNRQPENNGVQASQPAQSAGRVKKKQRLGPDGKPWRSRNRRGSDDVKRDQLVEQFLHENRLDVYDMPDPSTAGANEDGADGDADERLAEQFKRQFEEDVAKRKLKKKKPVQQPPAKAGTGDVLKGPKLGGSRNSRAAVRNMLLKEKETKK